MADWIGILKNVPWGEVVGNAPKIADGAKSLWGAVSKRLRPDDAVTDAGTADPDATLGTRVAVLEAQQQELRAQLATSSELLRSLAEQNAQLVARIDHLRRWVFVLAGGLAVTGGLAVAALAQRV